MPTRVLFVRDNTIEQCNEIANYILFEKLHFSKSDTVFQVVCNEFDTRMADEELRPFSLNWMIYTWQKTIKNQINIKTIGTIVALIFILAFAFSGNSLKTKNETGRNNLHPLPRHAPGLHEAVIYPEASRRCHSLPNQELCESCKFVKKSCNECFGVIS